MGAGAGAGGTVGGMGGAGLGGSIAITPAAGPVEATVTVPGSKSLTNHALLIAALARGRSTLTGALRSDDTR